jgi:hypothetical protein
LHSLSGAVAGGTSSAKESEQKHSYEYSTAASEKPREAHREVQVKGVLSSEV